ncbi:acyltransferase-like protein [Quercus suber]|uniref:Acyltransferase-like protein n=1 Tax=Quercus suber TaxID=58331 RepID=A0AAW0LGC9_QUESU
MASVKVGREGKVGLQLTRKWAFKAKVEEKRRVKDEALETLKPLWNDGYGTETVRDFFDMAKDIVKHDGGRHGMDGTGLGLVLHHKALGKYFLLAYGSLVRNQNRILEISFAVSNIFMSLTNLLWLVKLVEETVRFEHALSPHKPIYLVGDSFGGCLALAVASRNPAIDLVLYYQIQVSAATIFPILEAMPDDSIVQFPIFLALSWVPNLSPSSDPVKMAAVNIESSFPLGKDLKGCLAASLGCYHIFLGKDNMLPSRDEANDLRTHYKIVLFVTSRTMAYPFIGTNSKQKLEILKIERTLNIEDQANQKTYHEDGIGLMTVIKGTSKFRRSRRHSYASDFLPPSMTELNYACDQIIRLLRLASGSILFSTLEDGKIVKGLAGVPNEGPVILVGYHMLMGVELSSLAEGFLREKNIMVRGLAHPTLFSRTAESSSSDFSLTDWMRVFGAVPVTPSNLFKLLSTKSHVLLYPGGSREALHYKGEEYKLFWPDQQEFVRMAARFGATIVPFGVVGEDDVAELVLDYNDLMRIPVVNDLVKDANENAIRLRDEASGEVASQKLFIPLLMPKIPGRFYYLFGKPIKTKGREDILKDKQAANQLYLQVKSEVERQISFLIKKRQEDPYRSIVDRTLYKAIYAPSHEVPAFEP